MAAVAAMWAETEEQRSVAVAVVVHRQNPHTGMGYCQRGIPLGYTVEEVHVPMLRRLLRSQPVRPATSRLQIVLLLLPLLRSLGGLLAAPRPIDPC